jgi:hypothetical protein
VWHGFIQFEETSEWVFTVKANDGVRVIIDQQVVVEQMTIVEDELSGHRLVSAPLTLEAGKFYPLRIEYFEATENAFVTLLRRKASQTYLQDSVVDSQYLYFERSLVPIEESKQVDAHTTPRRPTNVF